MSSDSERARLAARLEHRLQSSLLLLREAVAREDLAGVAEHAGEVDRRARGLAAAATGGDVRAVLADWMGPGARWTEVDGTLTVEAIASHEPPEEVELGEPLVRLLAAAAGGELVSWAARKAVLRIGPG